MIYVKNINNKLRNKHLTIKDIGKRKAFLVFLAPSFLGVSIFVLIPFIDVIRRSFITGITGSFTGIENFKTVFTNKAFILAVKNTIRFTLVCLPLLIILGLLTALMLNRLKNIRVIKSMLLFPLAIPAATIVLIWKMVFNRQGFLNLLLSQISDFFGLTWNATGLTFTDYMGSSAAFWVLVASYIWKNLGYTVILWLAGFVNISTDIIEAAKADGAGEWKCFTKIIMPNLKGTLYTITVLSFLNSFKVFREAYLIAGSYPDKSMYLLQHLFNNWFFNLELDKMAAAAVCVGAILFTVIMFLQRLWEEKEGR